ncbi:MAG: SRPBCC domain-containing protein [Gemmatimonadaceae bacterium]
MKNIGAVNITMPSDTDIVITRMFDAPRVVVFEAWTKSEHVAHWWDPTGTPLAVCEIDLRPNGSFRWVNSGPNGEAHAFSGTYAEIDAPEKLIFVVHMFPNSANPVTTLEFTDNGNQTELTITMACANKHDRDMLLQMRVDEGTARTLENLASYLPSVAWV